MRSAGDHICKSVVCVSHGLDLSASLCEWKRVCLYEH